MQDHLVVYNAKLHHKKSYCFLSSYNKNKPQLVNQAKKSRCKNFNFFDLFK